MKAKKDGKPQEKENSTLNNNAKSEEDELSPADVVDAVKDIYVDYRDAYRAASTKDKAKILAIVMPLMITFVIGVIGIFLSNIGQSIAYRSIKTIGFILMGLGLGGFFLTIILFLIISKMVEKR